MSSGSKSYHANHMVKSPGVNIVDISENSSPRKFNVDKLQLKENIYNVLI